MNSDTVRRERADTGTQDAKATPAAGRLAVPPPIVDKGDFAENDCGARADGSAAARQFSPNRFKALVLVVPSSHTAGRWIDEHSPKRSS